MDDFHGYNPGMQTSTITITGLWLPLVSRGKINLNANNLGYLPFGSLLKIFLLFFLYKVLNPQSSIILNRQFTIPNSQSPIHYPHSPILNHEFQIPNPISHIPNNIQIQTFLIPLTTTYSSYFATFDLLSLIVIVCTLNCVKSSSTPTQLHRIFE